METFKGIIIALLLTKVHFLMSSPMRNLLTPARPNAKKKVIVHLDIANGDMIRIIVFGSLTPRFLLPIPSMLVVIEVPFHVELIIMK